VPSKLRVDTRPPEPYVTQVTPERIVAPGTSGITLNVRRISRRSPTDVRLWRTDSDPPKPVAEGRLEPGQREWAWDGKVDGKPAPPGIYLAQVSVTDQAGNIGVVPKTVKPGASHVPGHPGITVRALAAQPPIGPVTAGQRVTVAVDSRHRPYAWRLFRPGEKHPVAKGKDTDQMLAFKAPDDRSGLYLLELTAGRDRLLVPILVQATRHAKILVVVPMATWLGRAVVDDQGDGLPDTLDDGGPVR
jgi:hypothetical protein